MGHIGNFIWGPVSEILPFARSHLIPARKCSKKLTQVVSKEDLTIESKSFARRELDDC